VIISNEPEVTISPETDTRYFLKITTQSGQVLTNDILVRVLSILETRLNLSTGGIDDKDGNNLLTLNEVLSSSWIPTGNVVETKTQFVNSHTKNNAISLNNSGGLIFETDAHIPAGSSTLIAGISLDNIESIEIYNDRVDSTPLHVDTTTDQFYHIKISAVYDYENDSGWILGAEVFDSKNNVYVYKGNRLLDFGSFNTDLGLFLASGTKPGFYYGSNAIPVSSIKTNHLVCFEGESITLDASDSFDLDGDSLSFLWSSGGTGSTETVSPVGTTRYSVIVSDQSGGSSTSSITLTNCWMEKTATGYTLGAVLEDVKDDYMFTWKESGRIIGTGWKIEVDPVYDTIIQCVITNLTMQDTITFNLEGSGRVLHAKDPVTGIVEQISVYSSNRSLSKYIECKVDGKQGYIAYGNPNDPNASILHCKIPGDPGTYKILKR
jgi:hypothetical protein